jgi:hypothetical protein
MYTHVNKYKNDKIKEKKTYFWEIYVKQAWSQGIKCIQ